MPKRTYKVKKENSSNKNYFTKVHEDAILEYVSCLEKSRRDFLFQNLIRPAFNEMVDKIVYTYKFNTQLANIEDLKDECKCYLVTILDKYNSERGSKAFSYFSVITKNWFSHKAKKAKNCKDVSLEEMSKEDEETSASYEIFDYDKADQEDFLKFFREKELEDWKELADTEIEKKVINAIELLFENADNIEIFNKKAIYLYMREITGLNTKQVVMGLKRFRMHYSELRHQWENEKL